MMNKEREGATLPTQKLKYEPPRIEVYTVDLRESLLAATASHSKMNDLIFEGVLDGQEYDSEVFGTQDIGFGDGSWVKNGEEDSSTMYDNLFN